MAGRSGCYRSEIEAETGAVRAGLATEKGSVLVLTAIDEGVKPVSCPGNGPVRVATLNVEPVEQNVFILK